MALREEKLAYPPLPPLCPRMGERKGRRRFCPYTQDGGRNADRPSLGPFLRKSPFSSGRRLEAKRTTRHNTSLRWRADFKFIKSRAPAVQQVSSVAGGGGGSVTRVPCRCNRGGGRGSKREEYSTVHAHVNEEEEE